MKCECGENNWNIKEDDVYGICICTCTSCGYIESLYLENNKTNYSHNESTEFASKNNLILDFPL